MSSVLIIDPELAAAKPIQEALIAQGFASTLTTDAHQGLAQLQQSGFDILLLELDLPDQDGLQLLQALRRQDLATPIMILTTRDSIQAKVAGFEAGADDYLTKPFALEELLARIRACLRRAHRTVDANSPVLCVAGIELNRLTRQTRIGSQVIELPNREFTLAEMLFRHPERVFSREELTQQIWGFNSTRCSNVVDVYIGYLRKKLGPELIETVWGTGYRLNPNAHLANH